MQNYGILNVRGGSFCQIKLSNDNIVTLNQIISSVSDKCYICGNLGHYAVDCKREIKDKIPTINLNEKCDCPTSYFSSHRRGKCLLNNIISFFDDEDDDIEKLTINNTCNNESPKNTACNSNNNESKKNTACYRCGREGHFASSCYASKHINGKYLHH